MHAAGQQSALIHREIFGRQHHDGNGGKIRPLRTQGVKEGKAIHLRHHQIEDDERGTRLMNQAQGLEAVAGMTRRAAVRLERAPHDIRGHRVIFDHEHILAAAPDPARHGTEHTRFVDRLGQIIRSTKGKAHRLVLDHGHHHDRNIRRRPVALQGGEHGPTVHARHHDIERDEIRTSLAGQTHPLGPARGGEDGVSFFFQHAFEQVA